MLSDISSKLVFTRGTEVSSAVECVVCDGLARAAASSEAAPAGGVPVIRPRRVRLKVDSVERGIPNKKPISPPIRLAAPEQIVAAPRTAKPDSVLPSSCVPWTDHAQMSKATVSTKSTQLKKQRRTFRSFHAGRRPVL